MDIDLNEADDLIKFAKTYRRHHSKNPEVWAMTAMEFFLRFAALCRESGFFIAEHDGHLVILEKGSDDLLETQLCLLEQEAHDLS